VKRFRGGLVFKAHRLVYHSTPGWRVIQRRRESCAPTASTACPPTIQHHARDTTVKGSSNSHGARPVHLIITMMKWIRTSRLSMKNSLSHVMHADCARMNSPPSLRWSNQAWCLWTVALQACDGRRSCLGCGGVKTGTMRVRVIHASHQASMRTLHAYLGEEMRTVTMIVMARCYEQARRRPTHAG